MGFGRLFAFGRLFVQGVVVVIAVVIAVAVVDIRVFVLFAFIRGLHIYNSRSSIAFKDNRKSYIALQIYKRSIRY